MTTKALLTGFALLALAACGVEGPPVPPQAAATMQQNGSFPAMTGIVPAQEKV